MGFKRGLLDLFFVFIVGIMCFSLLSIEIMRRCRRGY